MNYECIECGEEYDERRGSLGYVFCLPCGEAQAKADRKSWCIAPMNKSNYILITNPALLAQLNPKRTTV